MYIQIETGFSDVDVSRYIPARNVGRKPTAILVLPGILSRWNEQIEPVIDILARYGTVFGVDYTAKAWHTDRIIANITDFVDHELSSYDKLVVVGISIGGIITPDVVGATKRSHDSISTVIVDAPHGADTMKELPAAARWFFTLGFYNILNGRLGNAIREKFMSVPPKLENIEVPAGVVAIEAYKAKVVVDSKKGLANHPWRQWGSQVAYMVHRTPRAGLLSDINSVYLACNSAKNTTVDQPKAVDRWHQALPSLKIIEVNTAHAAFREGLPTWQPKLVKAFAALGAPEYN